jgi:hypothetical protein
MNVNAVDEVLKTLETYFEGNKELSAEKIISVWHKDSKIYSTEKIIGTEGWIEMEQYYKNQINNDLSKWDIDFEIVNLSVKGNCASVQVDVKYRVDTKTFGETQFLHILRDKSKWLIYNKIFVFYPLEWK